MTRRTREAPALLARDPRQWHAPQPDVSERGDAAQAVKRSPSTSPGRGARGSPRDNDTQGHRPGREAFPAEGIDLTETVKGLVRVEEAARWLGLGRTKAWELVYSGRLHSVTIGRSRRVPMASLRAFVQQLVEDGGV